MVKQDQELEHCKEENMNSKHQWLITNSGRSASQSSKARKGSVGSSRKQTKAKFLRAIRMTYRMTLTFPILSTTIPVLSSILSLFVPGVQGIQHLHGDIFGVLSCLHNTAIWISGIPAAAQAFARIRQHPTSCLHQTAWGGKWWKMDLWSRGPIFETVKKHKKYNIATTFFNLSW